MYSENNLKELLKTGRAKCIFDSGMLYLTKGKSYNVWGEYNGGDILVIDDSNMVVPYPLSYFEPMNIASKTTENDTKGSFESGFKVGDKVYKFGHADVKTILEVFEDGYMNISNYQHRVNYESICHATQENYEMLCKLYPHIEFELPPKEITGSDLCCLMLRNKHTNIMCQVDGDETNIRIITLYTGSYFYDRSGNRYSEVVPIDTKGIPLTEDVLNDIN